MITVFKRKIYYYFTVFLSHFPRIEHTYRKYYHNKIIRSKIKDTSLLKKDQKKAYINYYKKYHRKADPRYAVHYMTGGKKFDCRYIPDPLYYEEIDRYLNDKEKAIYWDNKCLYPKLLVPTTHKAQEKDIIDNICPHFEHTERVLYLMNGYWVTPEWKIIDESHALSTIKSQNWVFIKKSIDSYGGSDIKYINPKEYTEIEIKQILKELGKDIIIEKPIEQAEILASLNPSSVNSIRIYSFIDKNGKCHILQTSLRMGRSGANIDNASAGGIFCGVEENGRLKPMAYSTRDYKIFKKFHPDTKVEFSSIEIPNFFNLKKIVSSLHQQLPYFRLIAWDWAIDKNGNPILIEVNLRRGGLGVAQLPNGPLFGDKTEEVLEEVYTNTKFPIKDRHYW